MLTGPRELEVVDIEVPDVGAGEVLLRVGACGICGSDVHGYDLSSGRRIPPLVMGHEAAGVVAAVGPGVTTLAEGDRVTFDSTVSCGGCIYCRAGRINLCATRAVVGVACDEFRRQGAFAEYVSVPERICYRLPDEIAMEHAALIEVASVALHAVSLARLDNDSTAMVVGAGMIGTLVVQALRARGVTEIIAVDRDASRLELARGCGATRTVDVDDADPVVIARELTNGRGVSHTYEAVGTAPAVATAIGAVERGGHVTLVGNVSRSVDLPLQVVVSRELTLYGSAASSGEFRESIELMRTGRIDVAPLVSVRASLDEGQSWFDRLYAGERGLMKVVLEP